MIFFINMKWVIKEDKESFVSNLSAFLDELFSAWLYMYYMKAITYFLRIFFIHISLSNKQTIVRVLPGILYAIFYLLPFYYQQYGISQLKSHQCSHALADCFRLSWRHLDCRNVIKICGQLWSQEQPCMKFWASFPKIYRFQQAKPIRR